MVIQCAGNICITFVKIISEIISLMAGACDGFLEFKILPNTDDNFGYSYGFDVKKFFGIRVFGFL